MKIKHTNQLEIAQNEIWTPRRFPAIRYSFHSTLIPLKNEFWLQLSCSHLPIGNRLLANIVTGALFQPPKAHEEIATLLHLPVKMAV